MVLVQDDADNLPLMFFHVIQEALLAGRLEATDATAEEQHAVLGAWCSQAAAPSWDVGATACGAQFLKLAGIYDFAGQLGSQLWGRHQVFWTACGRVGFLSTAGFPRGFPQNSYKNRTQQTFSGVFYRLGDGPLALLWG